jgi:hypothetical protein
MGIFATFASDGAVTGMYHADKVSEVPNGAVPLSENQWRDLADNQALRRWNGSTIVAYVPPSAPSGPVITSAVAFWKRASEEEAAIIEAGIEALPTRKRRLVNAAKDFWSTDEFYPELRGFLEQAFGETRAAELLASSA